VAIAVERNNTMDATLTFTLLLAAWAFIKATDSGKLRWLMLGMILVGLGFNIKMLQAYLPLPAFYALYFLGSREGWFRKIANLFLATVLLLVVSFSWAVIVDLTPPDQRPYVGSSQDNTVMELVFGHNGLNRLFGHGGGQNGPAQGQPPSQQPPNQSNAQADGAFAAPPAGPGQGDYPSPPRQGAPGQGPGALPQPQGQGIGPGVGPQGQAGPSQGPGGGGPGGSGEIGEPGVWRLFTQPLSDEIGWLLPVGLFSVVLAAVSTRIRLPVTDQHKALILWGGWLVTTVVFFSVAEFYHAYYLGIMGPPLAAMVAIGVVNLWKLHRKHRVLAWVLLVAIVTGTVIFQMVTIYQYADAAPWLPLVMLLLIAGISLLIVNLFNGKRSPAMLGATCLVLSMLVTPVVWSGLTTLEGSPHVGLPSAYAGGSGDQQTPPPERSNIDEELLDYLQANTQDVEYLMAVRSAFDGAGYIIETGRPVLYMGGFSGNDPVVSSADLAQMVEEGRLRYVMWGEGGRRGLGPGSGSSDIGRWLQDTCVVVTGVGSSATGAQSGNGPPQQPGQQGGPGGNRSGPSVLYQCGA
jgi:4-amino-4-deoxy-L-arabinose transferase-like glycosyltransferase